MILLASAQIIGAARAGDPIHPQPRCNDVCVCGSIGLE